MNTFLTPLWYTRDVAVGWKNNITLVGEFTREYNAEWADKPKGAQVGYTVMVRLPNRPTVSEGQAIQIQARVNQAVPVSITHQLQIASEWSSADAALLVEEVREWYTLPDARAIANRSDVLAGQEVYRAITNSIGAPGVPITSINPYNNGTAILRKLGVPGGFVAVIDPTVMANLQNSTTVLFNAGPRSKQDDNWKNGQFSGPAFGVDSWQYDPNLPIHVTGSFTASTPQVDGALQTGSTINIKGLGTYAFKAGDVFTLAGTTTAQPVSFSDTGALTQFTIQADVSGSSTATLTINPPIITSGSLQTVMASPANNAVISFLGSTGTVNATMAATSSQQGFVFNPRAFACVTADLPANLPGAECTRVNDKDAKLSIRRAEQWQASTDQIPIRMDQLIGFAPVQGSFGYRIWT